MVKRNIADFTIQFEFFNVREGLKIDTEKVMNHESDFCKHYMGRLEGLFMIFFVCVKGLNF